MAPPIISGGLEKYTGPWTSTEAAHLLRRATFGASLQVIQTAVNDGLNATIQKLIHTQLPSAEPGPLNHLPDFDPTTDPFVPKGQPWAAKVDGQWKVTGYKTGDTNLGAILQYRKASLRSWVIENLLREGISVREKMTLFWHNHFVTSGISDPILEFRYFSTLRENALGNFRELTKLMTIDPAMLIYLNGNENTSSAPNENYARELLELFTIGKGPLIASGDYSHYTEQDIQESARILTGWRLNLLALYSPVVYFDNNVVRFLSSNHDHGIKKLSYHFGEATFSDAAGNEYAQLVDTIFHQRTCAEFLARKLYRWFLYYEITASAEQNVIQPLATLIFDSNYDIKPALEALLGSEHFFEAQSMGPLIKNPLDFVLSALKMFSVQLPADVPTRYSLLYDLFFSDRNRYGLSGMQMLYFGIPEVAGWKAFYQEPAYNRFWINAATLNARTEFLRTVASGKDAAGNPSPYALDVLQVAAQMPNALQPGALIAGLSDLMYPQHLDPEQLDALRAILLPGLPDFEWSVEYGDFLANPHDQALRDAVETKLRRLMEAMLSMPEFYLS